MRLRLTRGIGVLATLAALTAPMAHAQSSGGSYTLRKAAIGAGVSAQSTAYRAVVTIAPPAAGTISGGSYRMTVGFHQPRANGRVFCDGFENNSCTSGAP